jgi:hypothetical protein
MSLDNLAAKGEVCKSISKGKPTLSVWAGGVPPGTTGKYFTTLGGGGRQHRNDANWTSAWGGGYVAPPQQAWLLITRGPYSGMAASINKWGVSDAKTQAQELLWQQGVGGNKAKIEQFCDVAEALQEFKRYIFMKLGGAFCTVVHSPMKFMAITEATQQLQGRFIDFVGDQTLYKEPTPILLPPWKTWEWVKATVAMHGPSLLDYYEEDPTWRGTLWTPAADCMVADANVPRLLHILLVLFERIRKEGRPLMPHEILAIVLQHIEKCSPDQVQAIAQAWQLVVQWCIVGAQKDPQGNSLVTCAIEAVTNTNNAYFCQ